MATLIDPDFRARLRALNEKYAAGVPALMQAIMQASGRCDSEGPRLEPLTELHPRAARGRRLGCHLRFRCAGPGMPAHRTAGARHAQHACAGSGGMARHAGASGVLLHWAARDAGATHFSV